MPTRVSKRANKQKNKKPSDALREITIDDVIGALMDLFSDFKSTQHTLHHVFKN